MWTKGKIKKRKRMPTRNWIRKEMATRKKIPRNLSGKRGQVVSSKIIVFLPKIGYVAGLRWKRNLKIIEIIDLSHFGLKLEPSYFNTTLSFHKKELVFIDVWNYAIRNFFWEITLAVYGKVFRIHDCDIAKILCWTWSR